MKLTLIGLIALWVNSASAEVPAGQFQICPPPGGTITISFAPPTVTPPTAPVVAPPSAPEPPPVVKTDDGKRPDKGKKRNTVVRVVVRVVTADCTTCEADRDDCLRLGNQCATELGTALDERNACRGEQDKCEAELKAAQARIKELEDAAKKAAASPAPARPAAAVGQAPAAPAPPAAAVSAEDTPGRPKGKATKKIELRTGAQTGGGK